MVYSPPPLSNYREFIEIQLSSPLIQNSKYCVEFFVSHAETQRSINTLGCLFTVDSFLTDSSRQEIFLIPQIENKQGIISDTENWTKISGQFTSIGGERFLTIGNFRNDSKTSVVQTQTWGWDFPYYYIDDVSVTLCDPIAVEKLQEAVSKLHIYPNPANSSVTITATEADRVVFSDISGRVVYEKAISNKITINTEEFENGIYFLSLLKNNIILSTEKLIVVR